MWLGRTRWAEGTEVEEKDMRRSEISPQLCADVTEQASRLRADRAREVGRTDSERTALC